MYYELSKFSNFTNEELRSLQSLTLGPEKGEMWHWVDAYLYGIMNLTCYIPYLKKTDLTIAICKNRNNRVVGWCTINKGNIGVFVHQRYRKRGIGTKLAEMIARQHKKRADIICSPWTTAGLHLYSKVADKVEKKNFMLRDERPIQQMTHLGNEILEKAKTKKNVKVFD